jgi:hypothetical protein
MCITEVWSFCECGCFYNHHEPCLRFQDQPLPADDCPNHRTIQKSFLNQICDDCLLAEIKSSQNRPPQLDLKLCSQPFWSFGDPLTWDSHVEVEIDGRSPLSSEKQCLQSNIQDDEILPVGAEDDFRIFDSHVEVTIENDGQTASTRDISPYDLARSLNSSPPISIRSLSGSMPPHWRAVSQLGQSKRFQAVDRQTTIATADDSDRMVGDFNRRIPSGARGRPLNRGHQGRTKNFESATTTPASSQSSASLAHIMSTHCGPTSPTDSLPNTFNTVEMGSRRGAFMDSNSGATVPRAGNGPKLDKVQGRKTLSPLQDAINLQAASKSTPSFPTISKTYVAERPAPLASESNPQDFAVFTGRGATQERTARTPPGSRHWDTPHRKPHSAPKVDHLVLLESRAPEINMSAYSSSTEFEGDSPTSVGMVARGEKGGWTEDVLPSIPKSSPMQSLRAIINNIGSSQHHRWSKASSGKRDSMGTGLPQAALSEEEEDVHTPSKPDGRGIVFPPRTTSLRCRLGGYPGCPGVLDSGGR